jgi:hypothetical protein
MDQRHFDGATEPFRPKERHMKTNRNFGSFETTSRRRRGFSLVPLIPVALVILLIAALWLIWSRGGEQPQQRVEKVIPAEKLGK